MLGALVIGGCVAGGVTVAGNGACDGGPCDNVCDSGWCPSPTGYDASGIHDAAVFGYDAGPHYPDGSAPPSSVITTPLPFDVVDAKQSSALGALVLVSKSPSSALHVIHTDDGTVDDVPLPGVPTAITLDPSEKFAAVGYDSHVSYVDLVNRSVLTTCNVGCDVFDLERVS